MSASISVGDIYKLHAHQSFEPKQKYIIIVAEVDQTFLAVFINTDANYSNLEFHPVISVDEYDFLEYNSHIDCSLPHEFPRTQILRSFQKNENCYVGSVSRDLLAKIISLLIKADTWDRWIKKKYFGEGSVKRRPRITRPPH